MKFERIIDTCLLTIGSAYSLANVEQILGIVILVIQLLWIIAKLWLKIYTKIKTKKDVETIPDDFKDAVDEISDITDYIQLRVGDDDE